MEDDAAFTRGAGISALASTVDGGTRTAEVEDGELVRRVRRGDDRAFEQLYHRYHRRITAYIHGMVHDHARAEDVAQDVFVSALRRMRDTDRPIAFKPWIYEIAKNACIDQFRRSRRAEEVSYDADEGMGAADYGRMVSSDAVPEEQLESKQNLDHLRGAFGGLSETHHEILVMRELEGLSYREIGERLGMSRPSVESTLFRARRRLTEEYEELVSGARCQRIQSIIVEVTAAVAPGARDQRRLARHISHCQPCRRQARIAGLDVPVTPDRPVRQRIAAMLPLPVFLRERWSADNLDATGLGSSHFGGLAQWSAKFGASVDPSWLKAAATAATVAVAGAGAGLAGDPAAPSATIGGLTQLLPSLQGGDDASKRISAGSGPPVAVGLRIVAAPVLGTAAPAAGAAESSRANGTPTGTDAPSPSTPASGEPDVVEETGAGLGEVATTLATGGDAGSGISDPSTGSGDAAQREDVPALSQAFPAPSSSAFAPPPSAGSPSAPAAPPVAVSATDFTPPPVAPAGELAGAFAE